MDAQTLNASIYHDLHRRRWSEDDLFFAIAWKNRAAIDKILRVRPDAVREQTPGGVTPVMLARWMDEQDIVATLEQFRSSRARMTTRRLATSTVRDMPQATATRRIA